jgi:nucleoside 2-deoxyribosyltransferase
MKKYNTPQEQLELTQITKMFPQCEIHNPHGTISSMEEAYKLIAQSDGIVATEHQEHIGKGVYSEIGYALAQKKPVFVLRLGKLFKVYSEYQLEVVGLDYAVYYAKVYDGFSVAKLEAELSKERRLVKKLHPGCGVFSEIAERTKKFLIHLGRLQILSELFSEKS